MSKLDKCAHRYPDDRPFDCCKLPREQHVPGMSHAFVEPVPQPPADGAPTRRKFEELVDAIGDLPTTALATSGLRPADPHVTVDGDGDASDEVIAAEMAREEIDTFGPPEDEDALAGIITKAIARGRELGARDEKDHARAMEFLQEMSQPTTYAGGCAWCGGFDEHGDICELRDWLAEVEARRTGRTP